MTSYNAVITCGHSTVEANLTLMTFSSRVFLFIQGHTQKKNSGSKLGMEYNGNGHAARGTGRRLTRGRTWEMKRN